jgi:phosphatidate cytidylyltransferase
VWGLAAILVVALTVETFSREPKPVERLSSALMMAAYPGLIVVPLLLRQDLRTVTLSGHGVERGAAWVTAAFLMVWITDTGAYFVGRGMGRRKLAPHLSPSKTWEGAVGGWLFATILGAALGYWGRGSLFSGGVASGLLLGALSGAWGQVGDLAESAMKRELKVKDFGGWLPGHGGVLDRFDSFLFVCPLVYLWSLL